MNSNVVIYDLNMKKVAYLENVSSVGYEKPLNGLHTAQFTLPAADEKNAECQPLRFVEIFDNGERVDLYRIMPSSAVRSPDNSSITYQCEHVLATLLDDVLFQYHTVGNAEFFTNQVVDYVLQKQLTKRWQVGTIGFNHQIEYNWENESLLGALFSIPKPFDKEYMWTWDTSKYPWTLNLVEPPNGVQAYIRYGVNMQGITKEEDPTDLCTRIYPLGYGEGVNQLTIREVNNNLPYLDADTVEKYGIISKVWTDRSFTSAASLKAYAQTMLNQLKIPRVSYQVDTTELYSLTKDPIDKFNVGSQVRVIDEEMGVDIIARVVKVRKNDVTGNTGNVQLEIANKPEDIAGSLADLSDRQRINEVYAQGATNYDSHDYADNCDPENPAVMKFFIPEGTARINKVSLSYESEEFRAYSKAVNGGGALSTSTENGGQSVVISETIAGHSERDMGATYDEQGRIVTGAIQLSESGVDMIFPVSGDEFRLTDAGGSHTHTVSHAGSHNHGGAASSHNHGNPQNVNIAPTIMSDGQHTHTISGGEHRHSINIDHTHMAKYHSHLIDHSHELTLPHHSHQINIPDHTHEIEYGIFKGARPNNLTIKVDGNDVPVTGTSHDELDIIPYLSKDDSGKVTRGTWHTIEIIPDTLGRIIATVNTQIFVQSRGGGNY